MRGPKLRDRRGETLFIDARKLGTMIDRVHRELTDDDITRIAGTYHAWRGDPTSSPLPRTGGATEPAERRVRMKGEGGRKPDDVPGQGEGAYADIPGFCRSATKEEIAEHGYVLTPGRYVGAEEVEDDDEPFEEKMQRLTQQLHEQFAESSKLEAAIRSNLEGLEYGK